MANTFRKIQTITVGSGGSATIEFTSIPQTFTDLKIVLSARDTFAAVSSQGSIQFNNNTSAQYSFKRLRGSGSAADSYGETGQTAINWYNAFPGANATASVFGNAEIYIPNYTSANNKSFSIETVTENNGTEAYQVLWAGLLSNTAAVTSIKLSSTTAYAQYSTATLYGISNVPVLEGAKATGGIITADNNYIYHTFLSSATFTPTQSITCDYLVVAGGGGGGNVYGGGGGAGGARCTVGATGGGGTLESALSLTATAYTVTVGAGGLAGSVGNNSVFGSITSTAGGRGATYNTTAAGTGGSGGGGGGSNGQTPKGLGTANQGFDGADGGTSGNYGAGGGGGAGALGGTPGTNSGVGGAGITTSISGTSTTYAGGGGGGKTNNGANAAAGGAGGGGAGSNTTPGTAGTANTGGGGGGAFSNPGGQGGSGIVIVRYAR
jgi:hypothetical protein